MKIIADSRVPPGVVLLNPRVYQKAPTASIEQYKDGSATGTVTMFAPVLLTEGILAYRP